jgi:predicted transcriptional regulator
MMSSQTRQAPGRRSAFEVKMEILRVTAVGRSKPTRIMYKSNTSWAILQRNLESLVTGGFMLKSGEPSMVEYSITERGMAVLHEYDRVIDQTMGYVKEVRA